MLAYFKDDHEVAEENLHDSLLSYVNKGIIPSWHMLNCSFLDKELFLKLTESSFLEEILKINATEFILHSPTSVQVLKVGSKMNVNLEIEMNDWQLWLEILSIRFKQNWNVQNPFVSFYGELFNQKFRFSLIHSSISPQGISKAFLRRIAPAPFKLSNYQQHELLSELVQKKKNILIAGGTGSGKTSLLNSMIQVVNPSDHLVILEDTHELTAPHPHVTNLLSGDSENKELDAYLAYTLRMSPDRIVLGEMRSKEIVPFVMAMNTGHSGIMSTVHASSAVDALYRLCLLFGIYSNKAQLSHSEVMELVCRNLEYVVFMENKEVSQIIKILGSDKGVPFFEYAF